MSFTAELTASYIGSNAGTAFSIYYDSFCTGSTFLTSAVGQKDSWSNAELTTGIAPTFPDGATDAYIKIEYSGTRNPYCIQCFGPVRIPGGGPVSPTPSNSPTPSPSYVPPTPSLTPSPTPTPISRPVEVAFNFSGTNISQSCTLTSGTTKYIGIGEPVSNGLIIYNDAALTDRYLNSDPNYFGWLQDTNNGNAGYGLDFDSNGNVAVVYTC